MEEDNSDLVSQEEELLILSSMFPEEFIPASSESSPYHQIKISLTENLNESQYILLLKWKFPVNYPSIACIDPIIEATWIPPSVNSYLKSQLIQKFVPGTTIILGWIEWLKEQVIALGLFNPNSQTATQPTKKTLLDTNQNKTEENSKQMVVKFGTHEITIFHGEPITDRKSKFQAHLAHVETEQEIQFVISELKKIKKIREGLFFILTFFLKTFHFHFLKMNNTLATHNIVAYRIQDAEDKLLKETRDDDGETGAGDKLLFLLQKKNALGVVVIVTRWFGGILLGNDR